MAQADRRVWLLIGGLTTLFALFVPLSSLLFNINYDYTLTTVAIGGAALGLVTGVLGVFAVLRQESLMGDALSHAALPGVAIAFLLFGRELGWLLIGAGVAGWLGAQFIRLLTDTTRIKQDTAMGIALTGFFAIGLALLTYIQSRPDASQSGLDRFIFGQAAAITRGDVLLIIGVGAVAFVVVGLFWKEFKLITFNPEFAAANGYPVQFLGTLLSTLIVVAIVLGLQLAGVILMVGMLIAPAVAARQWTNHLGQMAALAGIFGAFAGAAGAIISGIDVGLPTGPLIIVVAALIVFVSLAFAPGRGIVWQIWQRRIDKRRFAAINALRDLYAHGLRHDDPCYPAPEGFLVTLRGATARLGLRQLSKQGLALRNNGGWLLTDKGVQQAQADVHNQQLWERYRRHAQALDLPIIPEDAQRDITTLLPKDAIDQLEAVAEQDE